MPGFLNITLPRYLKGASVSHESIYSYIYQQTHSTNLFYYLRKSHKQRLKYFSRKKRRPTILHRLSIHARPQYINDRTKFGHWESDTMEFKGRKGALSVQYERKTMLVRIHKITDKSAQETYHALLKTIDSPPLNSVKSITFDNGLEGAFHHKLRERIDDIQTFFCDPFASWQKGGVENINGLIRQYLPKNTDMTTLSHHDILIIQHKLNNRPRKKLNFLSPNQLLLSL